GEADQVEVLLLRALAEDEQGGTGRQGKEADERGVASVDELLPGRRRAARQAPCGRRGGGERDGDHDPGPTHARRLYRGRRRANTCRPSLARDRPSVVEDPRWERRGIVAGAWSSASGRRWSRSFAGAFTATSCAAAPTSAGSRATRP